MVGNNVNTSGNPWLPSLFGEDIDLQVPHRKALPSSSEIPTEEKSAQVGHYPYDTIAEAEEVHFVRNTVPVYKVFFDDIDAIAPQAKQAVSPPHSKTSPKETPRVSLSASSSITVEEKSSIPVTAIDKTIVENNVIEEKIDVDDLAEKKTFLDEEFEKTSAEFNVEYAKSNANHDMLYQMALRLLVLTMHRSGRFDKQYAQQLAVKIKEHVKGVQDTHGSTLSLALKIVSAVISLGAGIAGFVPIFGTSIGLTAINSEHVGRAAQSVGTGGQAVGGLSSGADEKNNGLRVSRQHELDTAKEKRTSRNDASHQSSNKKHEVLRNVDEQAAALHRAIQQVLSVN